MSERSCALDVTVKPGAKAPGIFIGEGGSIVVRVRQRPIEGEANEAARLALADALGRPRSAVRLIRGATARRKVYVVDGLTASEAMARLRL